MAGGVALGFALALLFWGALALVVPILDAAKTRLLAVYPALADQFVGSDGATKAFHKDAETTSPEKTVQLRLVGNLDRPAGKRILRRVKLLVEWTEEGTPQRANAVTVDISFHGCMAIVGAPLPLHKGVTLRNLANDCVVKAKVSWRDHEAWDTGFSFLEGHSPFWAAEQIEGNASDAELIRRTQHHAKQES